MWTIKLVLRKMFTLAIVTIEANQTFKVFNLYNEEKIIII